MALAMEQGGFIAPSVAAGLPVGWEELWDAKLKKPFFVDHNTQTTTWIDPRQKHQRKHSFAACFPGELPYGWEKLYDAEIGEYYVNHQLWQTFLPEEMDAFFAQQGTAPPQAIGATAEAEVVGADGAVQQPDMEAKRERVRKLQAELEAWERTSGGGGGSRSAAAAGGSMRTAMLSPVASIGYMGGGGGGVGGSMMEASIMEEQRVRTEMLEQEVALLRRSMVAAQELEVSRNISLREQLRREREHAERLSRSLSTRSGGAYTLDSSLGAIDAALDQNQQQQQPVPTPRTARRKATLMTPPQESAEDAVNGGGRIIDASADRAELRATLAEMEAEVDRQHTEFRSATERLEEERRRLLGEMAETDAEFAPSTLPGDAAETEALVREAEQLAAQQSQDQQVLQDKMAYLEERTKALRDETDGALPDNS
eukprot:UC1_evm1s1727